MVHEGTNRRIRDPQLALATSQRLRRRSSAAPTSKKTPINHHYCMKVTVIGLHSEDQQTCYEENIMRQIVSVTTPPQKLQQLITRRQLLSEIQYRQCGKNCAHDVLMNTTSHCRGRPFAAFLCSEGALNPWTAMDCPSAELAPISLESI